MDNIEDILRALAEDSPEDTAGEGGADGKSDNSGDSGDSGDGLFSGLDFAAMAKAASLLGAVGGSSDNERLLVALKPLLREENQAKVDTAVKLLKLISLLPLLRELGLFGK